MRNTITTVLILINSCFSLFAQQTRLVRDFTPGDASTFTTQEEKILTSYEDKVLFIILDEARDFQLWTSNGEEDSTYLLHQFEEDAIIDDLLNLPESGSIFYSVFKRNANTLHAISKTTSDTTNLYESTNRINRLTLFKNSLYFKEDDNLMRIDLDSREVEIIYEFGSFRSIREIGVLNDQLIIIGGESNGTELYRSDGTQEGTSPYFQLNSGSEFNTDAYMNQLGDQLLFFYEKPEEAYILYATDGTFEGTKSLLELERTDFVDLVEERSIIVWNEKLFFRAIDFASTPNTGELFVSDGTPAGSFKIPLEEEGDIAKPGDFTPYNGDLYFRASFDLYKTDGTIAGTSKVIDPFELGRGGSFGGFELTKYQDSLYFSAFRSEVGSDLWISGGTTNTTRSLDIVPGEENARIEQLVSTSNYLFLIYQSPMYGKELFVLDSSLVSSTYALNKNTISIFPNPFKDHLFITADKDFSSKTTSVEVFDVAGRLVLSGIQLQSSLDLMQLNNGIYYIKIVSGEEVFIEKVVKN